MDMFSEEHEEQYWQQVYAARSNGIDRTSVLYVEPTRKGKKTVERNVTDPGKIEPTTIGKTF